MSYYEHHKRSFAKTINFQILVIVSDLIVVLLITHQPITTLSIIFFSNLVSAVIYFFHERVWNRIHWGKAHVEIDLPK